MPNPNEAGAKKRGRPRKPVATGERKSIAFRVTADLYNFLVSASDASGLSISEVVERHLEAQKNKIGRQELEKVFIGKDESVAVLRNYALIFAAYDQQGDWQADEALRAGILSAMHALNNRSIPLDNMKFGPGVDARDPQVARLNAAWAAGAQLGTLLAGPLVPADLGSLEEFATAQKKYSAETS